MIDKVFEIEIGMTKTQVDSIVGVEPYDLYSIDSNNVKTYTYVYRTTHIKRIPILMKRKSGIETEGLFSDLRVSYDAKNKVCNMETCTDCGKNYINESKLDAGKLITDISTFLTITIPSFLLFLVSQ